MAKVLIKGPYEVIMVGMSPQEPRTYLGVQLTRPRVAFFELSSCEGCQLQIVNNEGSLLDFLSLVTVADFREAMSERSDVYDIAFVEGSVTRADEKERLASIRRNARVLVAFGSCACFGGVNQLKNRFPDQEWVTQQVYGSHPIATGRARPLHELVPVDLSIFGCPVRKEEVERTVVNLVLGRSVVLHKYPVCMECKANEAVCLFDCGEPCLGPITRGGCDAWCPTNRLGCWGCRGPAEDANVEQMIAIMEERGFSADAILDRLECFGGFSEYAARLRSGITSKR